jgi:CO dehydrogenase nickel-insertion accessory protein CooC1
MKSKRQISDKLDRLRMLINGWAYDEQEGKSKEHKLNIQKLIREDLKFVNQLLYGMPMNITLEDMKKCNTIHKRYRAISNIKFGDKDPFEGVTIVKPDDTR